MSEQSGRPEAHSLIERRQRRDYLLLLVFFILFCGVLGTLVNSVLGARVNTDDLERSLHSSREADYGRDRISLPVPGVNLGIIYDILYDQGLDEKEIESRIATLTAVLALPVPTSTGTLSAVNTPVPLSTNTFVPTPLPPQPSVLPPTPVIPPTPNPTKVKPPPDIPDAPTSALTLTISLATYDDNDSSGTITLSDGLHYQFQIANTGDTPFINIFATDTTFGIPVTCPFTSLAPGASMLCTTNSPHVVTLAESNAGIVTITGFISGEYGGSSFTRTFSLNTSITQNPAIQLVKSLASYDDNDLSGSITQGDGLWYQFDLTNTGYVTVTNPGVIDDSFGFPVTCPPVSLAPGNTIICNTTTAHIVSAGEVTNGEVSNTATASVDFNAVTYTDSDTLVIPLSIQLIKSLASYNDNDASGTITLGDDLWYQFQVTNIGSLPLNTINVTDDSFGITVTCPSTTLSSGAAMTCTADSAHTVTLTEANAGNVQNIATVRGTPPVGPTVVDTSVLDTPLVQNAVLSISKSASLPTYNAPGQVVDYTFIVTNSGDVTVSGPIAVEDDRATDESCPAGAIDPGNSITCSASYIVTQADLDSGSVTNTAFATGTDPGGNPVASAPDTVTILAGQTPAIQIVKVMASFGDLDGSSSITLGDELWYRFNVSNTGNVTLNPVSVTDDSFGIPVTCPQTALAPGAAMLCAADAAHLITLPEANAGQVTNTATAIGELNGTPYTASDTITTPISQNPVLTLTKSALPVTYDTVGQVITYTYSIENSGDVTLAGPFSVTDNQQGTLTDCAIGPLDPGTSTSCTSTHTVNQADIDGGSITNIATVSGNGLTSAPDSVTVSAVQNPDLTLTKSGNPLSFASIGQAITYTYVLQNSGNVTLNGPFTITDNKTGTVDPCGTGPLAPGATTNCSAIYLTTQFDLDFGSLTNTATGSTSFGGNPVASNPDSVTATAIQSPSYTISKIVTDVGGEGPTGHADQAGDVISYQITLFNTGNVSLVGATASDPLLGALTGPTESGVNDGILGVGETWTYTGSYTVAQADIESDGGGDGLIDNTASASTTFLPVSQTASASVPVDQLPALTLTKSADLGSYDTVGQVITYTYDIQNSGNITLAGPFTVDDDRQGTLTNCASGPLAPAATTTCTATHTVTQADIDAGSITNTATATGNGVTSSPDSVTVAATQNPAISLTKSADLGTYDTVGQIITYTYTIENTGNVTLAGPFTVDDDRQGTLTDCAAGPLAPLATTTCTSTHAVAQADIDAGNITNTATASGNSLTSPPDSVTVNATQIPVLALTKSADLANYDTAGQVITYTYTIENAGNLTLAGPFTVSDDKQGVLTDCASGPLSPTGTTTCTSAHTVTQADIDAGSITNSATVSGNGVTSPADTVTINAIQTPAIQVVKSSTTTDVTAAGQVVPYNFAVTNTGNITLTGITVSDPDCDTAPAYQSGDTNADSLLDLSETWMYTCARTVTQAEMDAGGNLSNTVTTDSNESGPDTDTLDIPITQIPSMTVDKTSVTAGLSAPATVTYDYLVTNTGNITLTGLSLSDDNDNDDMICPSTTLGVGATMSCTATHTFTQAELDAGGNLTNNVTASSNEAPDATDTLDIPISQTPAIQVVKSSTTADATAAGQVVPYSFAITNVGNITLSGITVSDPNCDAAPAYQSGDTDTDNLLDLAETWTYTCSHTVTQTEMDAGGNLSNTVTVDSVESATDTDSLDIPVTQTPAIQIVKSSTTADVTAAGQVVPYSFSVTNVGNITLSGITVDDPNCDVAPAYQSGDTDTDNLLDLSETWTYACSRTVTQTEMDTGGNLSNTVTTDSDESGTSTDTLDIPITQAPAIQIVKSLASYDDNDLNGVITQGDNLWYQFDVSNPGNVTLTAITVSDDTFAIPVTCPVATLAPGDATTCTADSFYIVTPADTVAGEVSNTATATGTFDVTPYVESDTLITPIVTISPAFISGQVRDDTDGDGDLGDGDAGLANIKIELDNGVCMLGVNCASVLTDSNGIFTFASLPDGGYTLVQTDLANYISTADSDPPNDNQIDVIISGSSNSSGHVFLDTVNPVSCSAPDPVNGFVVSTTPPNGQTGVPMSTTTLTVTFDQPMKTSGGSNVLNSGEFDNNIDNLTLGGDVPILSVIYDPVTYTATLTIDTSDPQWQPGSQFRLRIKDSLRNACDVKQDVQVEILFTTETVISGQVLNIEDSEGIYGVTVELTGASCGGSCATTTTDLDGNFRFYGYTPGDYTLLQTNLPGFTSESDSDPPNDDQIALTLPAGSNSTGHTFIDRPLTCVTPTVASTNPADGATGVPLGTSTLSVTFDQPMITYGGGSVLDIGNFDNNIDNQSLGGDVKILSVSYDPNTYTATLTIDSTDPDWTPGSQFRLQIKSGLKNPCGANLGNDVDVFFTTAAFVSGQVLNNLDGNGIYGVLVELTGAGCGGSCGTTTTDLNGDFIFTGLTAGDYTLLQTNLPGYTSVSDSDPPNDDQIALTLPAGSNSTGHFFTDTPSTCTAPTVVSTNPVNGASGVSMNTTTLTVTFDQPMITDGGGSVLDKGNFDNNIDNQTLGGDVPIVSVSYNPNTYTATLTIDTSDPQWKPGSQFRLRINDGLKSACDVKITAQVDVFFTTDLVISGQVRNDLDGDGDLGDLEPGLPAVSIELYDGVCVLGSTCPTTITNSGGFFTFNNLIPGIYTIYETDPGGFVSTADSDGGNDNQILVTLVAGANSIGHRFLDYSNLPAISIVDFTAFEKDNGVVTYQFVVSLSKTSASTITVNYATSNGSATGGANCSAGVDFRNNSNVVTFLPGDSTKNINITVCTDTTAEFDEDFKVVLSGPTNAVISDNTGIGIIFDDDSPGFSTGNFVRSINPTDLSSNVPRSTNVVVEFNRDMCESTTVDPNNVRLFPVGGGADVTGTRVFDPGTRIVTFTPSATLSANTEYQVMVRFTKTQVDGCSLESAPYSQTFTTGN